MIKQKITFIGGGNMAQAMIAGLLAKGQPSHLLQVVDTDVDKLHHFSQQGLKIYNANEPSQVILAIQHADVVILAVKPQILKSVLQPLYPYWQQQLVISIVAGIETQSLTTWLGENVKIVRAMPNTPAMIQMGATGLFAKSDVSLAEKQLAEQILSAIGLVLWLEDESLLHAVTAISGSAPAYFFYLLEHMIATGEQMGLTKVQATALAMQTALGSAQMALTSHDSPTQLRQKVTSPNGTTQAALDIMNDKQMFHIIQEAMSACVKRSQEISQTLGQ